MHPTCGAGDLAGDLASDRRRVGGATHLHPRRGDLAHLAEVPAGV